MRVTLVYSGELNQHYFMVSFFILEVSIILPVSFFVVSTTVVLVESVTLVVSVVLVELAPLHAAKDNAIKAAKPNLLMCFIVD